MLFLLWPLTVFANQNLNDASQQDMICHSGHECYSRIFHPTETFQLVYDDQEIPAGLHIRMNFETGAKEAKLVDPSEVLDENQTAVLISPDGEIEPLEEEKVVLENHKPNPWISQDDHSSFSENIATLTSISLHDPLALPTLQALEELAHEIDFGIKIAQGRGMESLLNFLASQDSEIRAMAAMVIGSALQNNAPAQQHSAHLDVVYTLVRRLSVEKVDSVKIRMVYALNASIKTPRGCHVYAHADGGRILRAAVESAQTEDVIGKAAAFVQDNIASIDIPSPLVQSFGGHETATWQVNEKNAWCRLFQQALLAHITDVDIREKVLDSLSAIKQFSPDLCVADHEFLVFLANNTVGPDTSFVAKVKEIRHVFGNVKKQRTEEWKRDTQTF